MNLHVLKKSEWWKFRSEFVRINPRPNCDVIDSCSKHANPLTFALFQTLLVCPVRLGIWGRVGMGSCPVYSDTWWWIRLKWAIHVKRHVFFNYYNVRSSYDELVADKQWSITFKWMVYTHLWDIKEDTCIFMGRN